jgi:GNAT superfamily N-acetyltransferase
MEHPDIEFLRGDCREVDDFLAERIYEFNSRATGYFDGEYFAAVRRNVEGVILAGVSGYTWGGCCFISQLWVAEPLRRQGWGMAMLESAERDARSKGCTIVILSSHSFQAPSFYERLGYALHAQVDDHPPGHKDLIYVKRLVPDA